MNVLVAQKSTKTWMAGTSPAMALYRFIVRHAGCRRYHQFRLADPHHRRVARMNATGIDAIINEPDTAKTTL